MNKPRVYFAGGWFTPEMEEEHTRLYNLIKDDYDVFNPRLESLVKPGSTTNHLVQTLQGNKQGIIDADIVVAIYDRKDTGTIWETGFAHAIKKPIIYYAETLGDKPFNLMLALTGRVAKNEDELIKLLQDKSSYDYKDFVTEFDGGIE